MADIYVYAYVEDEPTKAVLKKMIEYVNSCYCPKFCDEGGWLCIPRPRVFFEFTA